MSVRRIVANLAAADPQALADFYLDLFELDVVMDQGWIVTLAGAAQAPVQLSLAREGGGGLPVPDLSIEVDDLDAVLERVRSQGLGLLHGPVDEPWGVRRFFIRDPAGRLLNVLCHLDDA